ncbi:MAG: hypothetical protein HFE90_04550 [Firmicutes bacterium]|nr:hypothetical protein [Bacillota bacterium]
MNWSKAKNIIIIVLIFTNIFIISMTFLRYKNVKNDDTDIYQYTNDILEENNIYLECELPDPIGKMHALTVSYGKYDSNMTANIMKNMPKLSNEQQTETGYAEAADKYIEKCNYMNDNVKISSVEISENRAVVTYKNYYKEIPLEECYMKVIFENGGITDFDRKWMKPESEGATRIDIMPPVSALLNFMTEIKEEYNEENKININDMYITYWIDSYNVNDDILYDTALPAWCIRYNGNSIKYISAIVQ